MANGQLSAVLQYPDVGVDPAPSILPLTVSGLSFEAAGRRLLDTVSFVLEAGTLLVVLGPNGAGKSLLLRLCDGLLTPTSGTLDWNGRSPAEARSHRAMVFQRPVLLRRSTAANIAYALGVRGVARHERKARIGLVGIDDENVMMFAQKKRKKGKQRALPAAAFAANKNFWHITSFLSRYWSCSACRPAHP